MLKITSTKLCALLFLIKEHVREYQDSDGQLLEKELYKYLKDNDLIEEDDEIKEEITFADKLLKSTYKLVQDEVDEDDKVIAKGYSKCLLRSSTTRYCYEKKMFEVIHDKTKDVLLVTIDIEEV